MHSKSVIRQFSWIPTELYYSWNENIVPKSSVGGLDIRTGGTPKGWLWLKPETKAEIE